MVNLIVFLLILFMIGMGVGKLIYPQNNIIDKIVGIKSFVLSTIAIILLLISNGSFFYGQAGYSYLVQYINGTQVIHTTPGIHFKGWGEVLPFKKYLTVKASAGVNEQEGAQNVSGRITHIPIRFNDSVTADVSLSVRFKLPEDKELFKKLALEFRSQENLVNSTLIPAVSESTRNSAKLVSAAEYMSGRGGQFDTSVLDQLRNGIYLLDSKTIKVNTVNEEGITDTENTRVLNSEEKVQYIVNIKTDKDGNPIVKDTVLKDLQIMVTQAIIDDIVPEKKFKDLLSQQMTASANASIKKEEAKTAEWDRQTIIAKGETEKATIKVEQEKLQIQKLIAAETQKKQADIQLLQSKVELEKAKIDSESTKTLADAEAYKKKKVMDADGALEIRLKAYVDSITVMTEALKGQKLVPDIVIGGSEAGGTSSMDLLNLMTAKYAKDLGVTPIPTQN